MVTLLRNPSPTKQKILLLLSAGLAFGFAYTPQNQWRIIQTVSREWKKLDRKKLSHNIRQLRRSRLVDRVENKDGSYSIILTERGNMVALTYRLKEAKKRAMKEWDGKWRLVVFDIPERLKYARDDLRNTLCGMGFYELQKSVLVFPYECEDEVRLVVKFLNLTKYVSFGLLESIDNEHSLKKAYKLS